MGSLLADCGVIIPTQKKFPLHDREEGHKPKIGKVRNEIKKYGYEVIEFQSQVGRFVIGVLEGITGSGAVSIPSRKVQKLCPPSS